MNTASDSTPTTAATRRGRTAPARGCEGWGAGERRLWPDGLESTARASWE